MREIEKLEKVEVEECVKLLIDDALHADGFTRGDHIFNYGSWRGNPWYAYLIRRFTQFLKGYEVC